MENVTYQLRENSSYCNLPLYDFYKKYVYPYIPIISLKEWISYKLCSGPITIAKKIVKRYDEVVPLGAYWSFQVERSKNGKLSITQIVDDVDIKKIKKDKIRANIKIVK